MSSHQGKASRYKDSWAELAQSTKWATKRPGALWKIAMCVAPPIIIQVSLWLVLLKLENISYLFPVF